MEITPEAKEWVQNRIMYKIPDDYEGAQDICQEVFLRIWKSRWNPEKGKFMAWVNVITENKIRDYYRNRKRDSERLEIVKSLAKEQMLMSDETAMDVDNLDVTQSLPLVQNPAHRRVFLLRRKGWAHREIAALLGCAESTSRVWLFRCCHHLRELIRI